MHDASSNPTSDVPYESDEMLARAARMDFGLMQHLQNLALERFDISEVTSLVRAYALVGRGMRQNLALITRHQSDRVKAARETERHEAWRRDQFHGLTDLEADRETLVTGVGRIIAAAVGPDRARHTKLYHRLEREADDWDFTPDGDCIDIEEHVRVAARRLGLPEGLARRWRRLPDPDFTPEPDLGEPAASDIPPEPIPSRPPAPSPGARPHWTETG